jgi:hypothetical protein
MLAIQAFFSSADGHQRLGKLSNIVAEVFLPRICEVLFAGTDASCWLYIRTLADECLQTVSARCH